MLVNNKKSLYRPIIFLRIAFSLFSIVVVKAGTASDDIQFNTDILDVKDQHNIDLERFSQRDYILPGTYDMSIHLNQQVIPDQTISFYAPDDNAKLSLPCLTTEIKMRNKIIINNRVIYDESSATLTNIDNKESVSLTSPANHCLAIILRNSPEISSQKELFEEVWESNGFPINANTFYQNISIIRKALRSAGIKEEVIYTIPRRGITIADGISITPYDNFTEHLPVAEVTTHTTYASESMSSLPLLP